MVAYFGTDGLPFQCPHVAVAAAALRGLTGTPREYGVVHISCGRRWVSIDVAAVLRGPARTRHRRSLLRVSVCRVAPQCGAAHATMPLPLQMRILTGRMAHDGGTTAQLRQSRRHG